MEARKGREIRAGMKVKVYVNLNKQGKFSVVDMASGLVCGYVSSCLIKNAEFHVSPSGREEVRRTKRKMVHAWVRGIYLEGETSHPADLNQAITYNPYRNDTFVDGSGYPVYEAREAYFAQKKVFI